MATNAYEAILFDKDGTLFDFRGTWEAWARRVLGQLAGEDHGLLSGAADAIGFDLDTGFHSTSVVIAGTTADVEAALQPVFPDVEGIAALLDRAAIEAAPAPVPMLHETLALLGATYELGVVTNDAEAPARAHLAHAGITDHFGFIAGYDSGFGGKPAPGQLLGFCNISGIAPEHCVMVGDSLHDLHAGRAAGMAAVGVLTGVATEADLAPFADVVLPGLAQLPHWLDRD